MRKLNCEPILMMNKIHKLGINSKYLSDYRCSQSRCTLHDRYKSSYTSYFSVVLKLSLVLGLLFSSFSGGQGATIGDTFSIDIDGIDVFEKLSEERTELFLDSSFEIGNCFMAQTVDMNVEISQWERIDPKARTFRTSKCGGPPWEKVSRRVTVDLDTNKVVEDIKVYPATSDDFLHRQLPAGVSNIKTILYFSPSTKPSRNDSSVSPTVRTVLETVLAHQAITSPDNFFSFGSK